MKHAIVMFFFCLFVLFLFLLKYPLMSLLLPCKFYLLLGYRIAENARVMAMEAQLGEQFASRHGLNKQSHSIAFDSRCPAIEFLMVKPRMSRWSRLTSRVGSDKRGNLSWNKRGNLSWNNRFIQKYLLVTDTKQYSQLHLRIVTQRFHR